MDGLWLMAGTSAHLYILFDICQSYFATGLPMHLIWLISTPTTHLTFPHSLKISLHWLLHLFHTWRLLLQDQLNVSLFFYILFLSCYIRPLNLLPPNHSLLSFLVNNLCDTDQSDEPYFITQANFIIPATDSQNDGSTASEDHDMETQQQFCSLYTR